MNLELILNFLCRNETLKETKTNLGRAKGAIVSHAALEKMRNRKWKGGMIWSGYLWNQTYVWANAKSLQISQSSSSVFVVTEGPQVDVYAAAPGTALFGLEVDMSF